MESTIEAALAGVDVHSLRRTYQEDDGLVVVPNMFPSVMVADMVREAQQLRRENHRARIPFVRKAGAIRHAKIAEGAPTLHALHTSPSLLRLCQQIAGPTLEHRRAGDPHASALYVYDRAGDHVGWHRDDCGCVPEASFTAILGLVNRSKSCLEFELWKDDKSRRPERRAISTEPGTFVFFCGSRAHHRITPLERGEERISFSFVYVKKGHQSVGYSRVHQAAINTFLYFGARAVVDELRAEAVQLLARR